MAEKKQCWQRRGGSTNITYHGLRDRRVWDRAGRQNAREYSKLNRTAERQAAAASKKSRDGKEAHVGVHQTKEQMQMKEQKRRDQERVGDF